MVINRYGTGTLRRAAHVAIYYCCAAFFAGALDQSSSFGAAAKRGVGGGGVTPAARITSCNASSVSKHGRKFPGRKPSAMLIGVQPHWFVRFQMSIFAPFCARS